jgi:uncharacterized membrane protein
VPDPYEIDDEGRPVAEADDTEVRDDAEEAAMRRQIETTLRFMRLQTIVGLVVILALIAFLSDIRGVLILVLIIFAFSSFGAYWWLRRNLNARLGRRPGVS